VARTLFRHSWDQAEAVLRADRMATLYITECKRTIVDTSNRYVNVPSMPPVTEQSVPIGGTSAAYNPFNTSTRFIIVNADTPCSLAFGPTPVAVATAHRVSLNETRSYGVMPGQTIAVIANT
jgi:hypothetical protein